MDLRTPPQDTETEKMVLSGMMVDPEALMFGIEDMKTSYFYRPAHQIIFSAMIEMYKNKIEVDLITLQDELKKKDKFDEIGGIMTLVDISNSSPSSANIKHYINIIKRKSTYRSIIKICVNAVEKSFEEKEPTEKIINEIEGFLFKINSFSNGFNVKHISDYTSFVKENYESFSVTQFKTGLTDVDNDIMWHRKWTYVLAGAPGSGKSSLATCFMANISFSVPTGFFSLEMSGEMVNYRMGHTFGKGSGFERYKSGIEEIGQLPIYIDDTPALTLNKIRGKALRMIKNYGIEFFVLDYLQLGIGEGENETQRIGSLSQGLASLAKETNTCWIILSQLTKDSLKNADQDLGDIRGSGQIVQDARGVYFIIPDNKNANVMNFKCKKQNMGKAPWSAQIYFDKEHNKFKDYTTRDDGWG